MVFSHAGVFGMMVATAVLFVVFCSIYQSVRFERQPTSPIERFVLKIGKKMKGERFFFLNFFALGFLTWSTTNIIWVVLCLILLNCCICFECLCEISRRKKSDGRTTFEAICRKGDQTPIEFKTIRLYDPKQKMKSGQLSLPIADEKAKPDPAT